MTLLLVIGGFMIAGGLTLLTFSNPLADRFANLADKVFHFPCLICPPLRKLVAFAYRSRWAAIALKVLGVTYVMTGLAFLISAALLSY